MFHWDDWEQLFALDCTDSGSNPEFHTQRLIYSVPWTKILSLQGKHKTREENSRAASTENLFSSLVSCLCCFVWISFQLLVRVWTAIIFPWSNSLRLGQVRLLWTGLVFSFWPHRGKRERCETSRDSPPPRGQSEKRGSGGDAHWIWRKHLRKGQPREEAVGLHLEQQSHSKVLWVLRK